MQPFVEKKNNPCLPCKNNARTFLSTGHRSTVLSCLCCIIISLSSQKMKRVRLFSEVIDKHPKPTSEVNIGVYASNGKFIIRSVHGLWCVSFWHNKPCTDRIINTFGCNKHKMWITLLFSFLFSPLHFPFLAKFNIKQSSNPKLISFLSQKCRVMGSNKRKSWNASHLMGSNKTKSWSASQSFVCCTMKQRWGSDIAACSSKCARCCCWPLLKATNKSFRVNRIQDWPCNNRLKRQWDMCLFELVNLI